jgi:hypothetical protein
MLLASYPQGGRFLTCFFSCLFLFIGVQTTPGVGYRGAILPFFGLALPFFGLLCFFSGYSAFFRVILPQNKLAELTNSATILFRQNNPKGGRMAERTQKEKVGVNAQKSLQYVANDPNRTPGERWITMSNALTRAGHGLTLAEKRIVMMAVSKIDSIKPIINPTEPYRTKITAAEYAAEFGVDMNTAYDQLQSGAKSLLKRVVTFHIPAHKRDGKPLEPTIRQMHWIGQADYQRGEGWVELYWWNNLLPHLTGLKRQFTSYQLQQASALRSVYSWRLLELLTRFESTGWAEYTIEDFVASMDATDKQRSDFAAIRRKIIEPSIKELQDKDGWLISWQPIKAGRKVKALRFEFSRNPQTSLF